MRLLHCLLINFTINFQVGGNRNAKEFFKSQPDWSDSMTIEQKYNTKAAALYRDKVNLIICLVYFVSYISYINS